MINPRSLCLCGREPMSWHRFEPFREFVGWIPWLRWSLYHPFCKWHCTGLTVVIEMCETAQPASTWICNQLKLSVNSYPVSPAPWWRIGFWGGFAQRIEDRYVTLNQQLKQNSWFVFVVGSKTRNENIAQKIVRDPCYTSSSFSAKLLSLRIGPWNITFSKGRPRARRHWNGFLANFA